MSDPTDSPVKVPETEVHFGAGPTQGDHGPDDVRWTPRRIRNTAWYAVVGAIIGLLMGTVMFTILLLLTHAGGYPPFALVGLAMLLLGHLGIFRASDGTCRTTPVAPRGISIGLFIGALFAIPVGHQIFRSGTLVLAIAMAMGLAFFAAGYYGGKRGVRRRFGLPSLGVGIVCAHCGYDLSATPPHRVCSECGGSYRYAAMPPA